MILLDLFSGIGGFSLGLDKWVTKHYYSEIDKHAIAIYKHNFKESEYVGSVESIGDIERPNIITFGSPCQDFSIAGKRSGLEGSRSSLIQYALNTISKFRPDVFIWENVKGVFSSNDGADFWAIVKAFADIGGYRLEWQLLNTAWFLPQNRERIYLIGHLAEGSTRNIFPIGESDGGSDEGSVESTNVRCLQGGGHSGGHHSSMTLLVEPTHKHGDHRQYDKIAPTVQARYGTGGDNVPYVVQSNAVEIKMTQLDSNGKGQKSQSDRIYSPDGLSPTLPSGAKSSGTVMPLIGLDVKIQSNAVEVKMIQNSGDIGNRKLSESNIAYSLRCSQGSDGGQSLVSNNSIRRLTEIECERLQGFPDNWTQYGDYDEVKKVSKTQRYKCLGNAITVNVVREIGRRIYDRI